jgi:hypothetical protein
VNGTFFVQYTTLILIILTFVLGSFIRPQASEKQPDTPIITAVESEKGLELTTIKYESLFGADNKINSDNLAALESLLLSHDIDAEITVFGDQDSAGQGRFAVSLARSIALYRYLRGRAIPASALRVTAREGGGRAQAQAFLRKAIVEAR